MVAALGLTVPGLALLAAPASASSVSSAAFTGGSGTVSVGGTLYAKNGGALILTVTTSSDTKCVDVTGAFTAHQTSSSAKSSWTFTSTAGAGDGVQTVTATASPSVNANDKCTGASGSVMASYTLDNTGPVVTAALSPTANGAGWNNANVSVTWSAADAGSGVATGPTPSSDSQSANTASATKTSSATDRLGNVGNGTVAVKLDKMSPTIIGSRSPAANGNGWNNTDVTASFTCSDGLSGVKSCSGPTTLSTSAANQSVTGTAVDNADNTASTTVGGINIDKVAPSLTGAPTTSPNVNGWYNGNVTIHWTCSDALSGIDGSCPANSTLSGEGSLAVGETVLDKAGNSTSATSTPVKIDKTAPATGISGTSNNWVNGDVTVSLSATDNLSGIASTSYSVDGGATQTGTSFTLGTEGIHTITFFSTDRAGNAEAPNSATVKIDKTAPTISHVFTPLSYTDGAWINQDVTVTFACADQGGSGVATCSQPVTKTAEGAGQQVVGTATDGAGNSATDTAVVSIDKTAPSVTATADREPNGDGWYNGDVTVTFAATDALSGVATTSGPQVLGEGADQSATGSATDTAGNTASAALTGINVDKTAPVLTGTFSPGWHAGDVSVHWTCTDALSGVAAAPADDTVTGEGDNLSSSATCTDKAGNTASKTVSGIKIDRTAPTTTVEVPKSLPSGWYAGAVQVTLTGHDTLSGVAATLYSVDGGATQAYTGPFSFADKGTHTIAYWSLDAVGNVEDLSGKSLTLNIDGTPPTTTVINPISPASGWFVTTGIPVAFSATDGESGVAATFFSIDGQNTQTYGEPFTETLGTGEHTITYWSVDLAGNAEVGKQTIVRVDIVPPTITGSQAPAANAFGWNNSDVNVTFACDDADSGINRVAGCSGDTTLANEGAGQTVHGDAVDVAGNSSGVDYSPVNIDKTKPTLTGVPTTDANGAGWYNGDVTVHWVGDDALSGLDPATQPADSTVTGEGANLVAGPVTVQDKAGNGSDPATVSSIRIDRTPPSVSGKPTTSPNAAGWYKDEVVVDFTCTDALSGVASCPTSKVVKGDGANQSVSSDPAADKAGNSAAGVTVGGISIDGTAPSSTANNLCTSTNGWCAGTTADVVIEATDQAGLSGVKELHYVIDGGAEQVSAGGSKTVSVPLSGSGAGTVKYWAVDNAGNAEAPNSVALKWDNIAPTVTHALSPSPNADDWNNGDVTVTFTAKDDDKGSGVASVTAPVTVSTETAGKVITGTAKDTAGNVGTDSVTVKLDKTAPTISAAVTSGAIGTNGWYVGPVTVHFTCGDSLSGVAVCPDDVVLTANGANSATGTATDKAGNTAKATVSGITIDQEKPTLTTADVNVQGASYTLGSVPAATCTASDSVSGVASCKVTVTGGSANGVGTFGYAATATDKAGNTTTVTGTFKVVYRFDGFLQPINDTAHQIGTSTSIFKAGSTVPAKFQLKKADGTVIPASGALAWLTPVKGSATTAPVDESVYTDAADSGSTYRWDSTAQQYIYNWKTGTGGNYWRIGVKLDDGQTYSVNIGLK